MYVSYFKDYLNKLGCDLFSNKSKQGFGNLYNKSESNKYGLHSQFIHSLNGKHRQYTYVCVCVCVCVCVYIYIYI